MYANGMYKITKANDRDERSSEVHQHLVDIERLWLECGLRLNWTVVHLFRWIGLARERSPHVEVTPFDDCGSVRVGCNLSLGSTVKPECLVAKRLAGIFLEKIELCVRVVENLRLELSGALLDSLCRYRDWIAVDVANLCDRLLCVCNGERRLSTRFDRGEIDVLIEWCWLGCEAEAVRTCLALVGLRGWLVLPQALGPLAVRRVASRGCSGTERSPVGSLALEVVARASHSLSTLPTMRR